VKRLQVDPHQPEPEAIEAAAAVILEGGLVAFPTETVYGLGGNALDPAAVARIYDAKGRPAYNPLIAHCESLEAARLLAREWSAAAEALGTAFWPGPLTLVVAKSARVPAVVTAGLPTVAVRVPSHPVAAALLRRAGVPIAAPSANRFMELSPTRGEHVLKGLARAVDLVLDSGPTPLGIESTVVDVTGPEPVLLRPGTIGATAIEAILGMPLALPGGYGEGTPRPSPGMIGRHYSPGARLVLIPRGSADRLAASVAEFAAAGAVLGALLREMEPVSGIDHGLRMPRDPPEYARSLYSALHELDERGCTVVLVEEVPATREWAGVHDRLKRAAAE
jgi:L-threonylcarbamoyladenylate synthase